MEEVAAWRAGTVKWYDSHKGFGFVVLDEDAEGEHAEVFIHSNEARCATRPAEPLLRGERVLVTLTERRGRPEVAAIARQPLHAHAQSPTPALGTSTTNRATPHTRLTHG
jgi:cold shock CspA family protein